MSPIFYSLGEYIQRYILIYSRLELRKEEEFINYSIRRLESFIEAGGPRRLDRSCHDAR